MSDNTPTPPESAPPTYKKLPAYSADGTAIAPIIGVVPTEAPVAPPAK